MKTFECKSRLSPCLTRASTTWLAEKHD